MELNDEQNRQSLLASDRRYVWHAFGPSRQDAWMVDSADGVYVTDVDGRRYLDAMSGLWCVNAGYGHERIARKVYEQMVRLPYYPLSAAHEPAAVLAEKLNEWLEGDYRVFFGSSWSEANETAFKLARQYHTLLGRPMRYKIISRYRAYHGATLGALSATGQHQRKFGYEPMAPGFIHIHPPDPYREAEGQDQALYGEQAAQQLEMAIVWEGSDTVAAFVMEPIITGGGVLVPPANYLPRVAEICRQYGVLLIVDEVICGFGRTGKNFGFQHSGVQPDIVTMAKGLTSAYLPLSATAVSREVAEVFADSEEQDARFRQVNTFGGHPVSCAAALENLAIFEELGLVARSARLGELFLAQMNLLRDLPNVGDVRGMGLLAGIELVEDKKTKVPLRFEAVTRIVAECKERGVIVGRTADTVGGFNNVITVAPPLTVEEDQIRLIVDSLRMAIANWSV